MGKVGEAKRTNRSAWDLNRREQLPGSKLIPYLGLRKKSIGAWKGCNRKQNAKVFPCATQKESAGASAAPAVLGLIGQKLERKCNKEELVGHVCGFMRGF